MTEAADQADAFLNETITQEFGERCPDFDPGCITCQLWRRYDARAATPVPVEAEGVVQALKSLAYSLKAVEELHPEYGDNVCAWGGMAAPTMGTLRKVCQAATLIESQGKRIEELRKALEPFAQVADEIDRIAAQSHDDYDRPSSAWADNSPVTVQLCHCRRARSLCGG